MAVSTEETIERHPKRLTNRFVVKAFVICLSFANLTFLNAWAALLNRQSEFFRKYAVNWRELAAVTLDVILLALVLWIPVYLVARSQNRIWVRILKWSVFAGLVLLLNIFRTSSEFSSLSSMPALQGLRARMLITLLGSAAGILLLWKWEKLSALATSAILVVLAPMMPLIVASVAWNIHTGPPAGRFPDRPLVRPLPQKAGAPHVLWFIFDEWDESLTFVRRPAHLELPELDRFRSQSFHAGRAFSPSRQTLISVPSLLIGKTLVGVQPNGARELLLTYDRNQSPERLTAESSVFSEARSAGFNVGIVGFFLPYCRLFDTTACEAHSAIGLVPAEWEERLSVARLMVLAAKRQVPLVPFARRLGITRAVGEDSSVKPSLHAVTYRQTLDAVRRLIVDSRLNLVFVHWNVPHPPVIYDAATDAFSNAPGPTYLDNLRLVDRSVRDIRLTLEKAGAWDNSTILITADHPLRLNHYPRSILPATGDYSQGANVPFLLKLAGQKLGFAYNPAMQTVVTKDLLLAIMKGEITQPEQVAAWLDHNPPRR